MVVGTIGVGLFFSGIIQESRYDTTGVVVDKTIVKSGWGSKEVCVVDIDGERKRTTGHGCLYSTGEKVKISVSSISVRIIGLE